MIADLDLNLCHFSAASYEQHTFAAGNVEALYSVTAERRVLAFTGTKFNFSDILADLRTVPWWDDDLGWCHAGIMKGARDDFWPRYWEHVLSAGQAPLWLTGHSKGGGSALIFGAKARAIGAAIAGIVTFGAPMVLGDRGHQLLWDIPVRQYRNGVDIVPTVPKLLGGTLKIMGHARPLRRIGFATNAKDGPFTDHRIADYLKALLEADQA